MVQPHSQLNYYDINHIHKNPSVLVLWPLIGWLWPIRRPTASDGPYQLHIEDMLTICVKYCVQGSVHVTSGFYTRSSQRDLLGLCQFVTFISAFFNLFSEAEPIAAILIAHGTHVFLGVGDSWGPKSRNSRPKADSGGGGSASSLPTC